MIEYYKNLKNTLGDEPKESGELDLAIENVKAHLLFFELDERLEMVQNAIVEAERCNGINL